MTKLTPAQAYALQVKADRRARVQESRQADVAADDARVKALYAKTKTVKINPNQGSIPVSSSPADVQELVAKIAPLWKAQTGFDFPSTVWYGPSDWNPQEFTFWVDGFALNSLLPSMYRRSGKLCGRYLAAKVGEYRFRTPALTTVYSRLRRGLPIFA